jgi:hypothetical protein
MMEVDKTIFCWKCKNLDSSDLNDYTIVNFCGITKNEISREIEEDLSNGELHPLGKCDDFQDKNSTKQE